MSWTRTHMKVLRIQNKYFILKFNFFFNRHYLWRRLIIMFFFIFSPLTAAFEEARIFYRQEEKEPPKVWLEKVFEVIDLLDSMKEPGILFNRTKIKHRVEGGTCTAMSMDFAVSFLQLAEHAYDDEDLRVLGCRYAHSSEEIASRQVAFNTIEVIKDLEGVDYALNKLQSLANYHGLKIQPAGGVLEIRKKCFKEGLECVFHLLPIGVYFIRILETSDNEKLEIKGHTMVLIKEEDRNYLYEPNEGLIRFNTYPVRGLRLYLYNIYYTFGVHQVRFYKIIERF